MLDVLDIHTHTTASGHAYNTIYEMAQSASRKGLALLGISDHGPAMEGSASKHYFRSSRCIPRELYGVKILFGCELNIMDYDGGVDLDEYSNASVRRAIAYVPQNVELFSKTIYDNIRISRPEASLDEVKAAAKKADAHEFIRKLPLQYNTYLEEAGNGLSGGEKQRISIARALLKDAPILILDDSVSAVDTRTEKIILDNLKSSRANKTTLLIAHRISTVERLDKIIFLDDGKIEAVGPHDELYTSCPKYRRMVDLQRLEDEAGGDDNA